MLLSLVEIHRGLSGNLIALESGQGFRPRKEIKSAGEMFECDTGELEAEEHLLSF